MGHYVMDIQYLEIKFNYLSQRNRRAGGRGRGTLHQPLPGSCCCCLPCKHCTVIILVVEEILAYGNRLRFTHSKEFH